MPPEVTVREASSDDVGPIRRVARTACHAAYEDVLDPSTVDDHVAEGYRPDVLHSAVENDRVTSLVASAGDVVGYATAGPSEEADDRVARVYGVFVDPDRWRDGIGSRLFDAALDRLRAEAYRSLRTSVLEANDVGRSFCESYGFPVTEETTRLVADREVPAVVYAGTL